jgi:hypothetical protein
MSQVLGIAGAKAQGIGSERATVVYERSRALSHSLDPFEPGAVALDLLDAAGGSQSTLDHALRIARRQLEHDPGDVPARLGIRLIETAIGFLGQRQDLRSFVRHGDRVFKVR